MMRHLWSEQMGDFAAIYDEDVELVSVARPRSQSLEFLAEQLLATREDVQARWDRTPGDPDALLRALPESVDAEGVRALSEEIGLASDLLGDLLGCDRVGIRLSTLRGPMCPRFHVDRVPCRMLITIRGPGTEWIPSDDVDPAILADRGQDTPPVRAGRAVRQLPTRCWSLLKGGDWDDRFGGVVHRSPLSGGERLLLSLDPVFSSADERTDGATTARPLAVATRH